MSSDGFKNWNSVTYKKTSGSLKLKFIASFAVLLRLYFLGGFLFIVFSFLSAINLIVLRKKLSK